MILEELKGRRSLISFYGRNRLETAIVTVVDVDDKFLKVKSDAGKTDEYDISGGIYTYLSLGTIDSITDVSDEKAMKIVQSQIKAAQRLAEQNREKEITENAETQ